MDPPLRQHYTSAKRGLRESFKSVEECVRASGVAPALEALSFRRPIHKPLHVVAVLPGKGKKLSGGQISGFFPEKSLQPPTHIRTFPRLESIAPSRIPLILQLLEHFLPTRRIP